MGLLQKIRISELQSSTMQEHQRLKHETEILKGDIGKMRSEIKLIHDELEKRNSKTTDLTAKLDWEFFELMVTTDLTKLGREIHELRTQLVAAKDGLMTIPLYISAASFAALLIMM